MHNSIRNGITFVSDLQEKVNSYENSQSCRVMNGLYVQLEKQTDTTIIAVLKMLEKTNFVTI